MKLLSFVLALWTFEARASSVRGSLSSSGAIDRPRGFADADPGDDESFKMMQKSKLHGHHGDHRIVPKSSGGAFSRELQHQVEQMVSRVKHLHDKEASIEFANELTALEEELGSSTADKALIEEVNNVRADLCTQLPFEDTGIDNCESFMESSCSQRPLLVSSHFCAKFFRQRKHGRSDAPAEGVAVKFTASSAEDANENEGSMANNAAAQVEQLSSAPGPAAGPAPGPVPMGVIFGGKVLRPLPDQGFDGTLDQYKDTDQKIENWQLEFGPNAGHRDYKAICAEHQDNAWCRLHGYGTEEIIEVVEPTGSAPRMRRKSSAACHNPTLVLTGASLIAAMLAFS